jgi:hypothetical protein
MKRPCYIYVPRDNEAFIDFDNPKVDQIDTGKRKSVCALNREGLIDRLDYLMGLGVVRDYTFYPSTSEGNYHIIVVMQADFKNDYCRAVFQAAVGSDWLRELFYASRLAGNIKWPTFIFSWTKIKGLRHSHTCMTEETGPTGAPKRNCEHTNARFTFPELAKLILK